jgi:ABC-type sugar transport system substrate-binding protein
MRVRVAKVLVALFVLLFVAGFAFAGGTGEKAAAGPKYKFTMVIYGTVGNPFWKKVVAGAKDGASGLGADLDIQYADDDSVKQVSILETAIVNRMDGIGIIINLDDAYTKIIQKAREAGIPVVAYNIDSTKAAAGTARMAFVGQDFVTAGYLITKRLIATYGIKSGDHVVCPVEHPEAVYAAMRYEGVKKALDEVGASSEVLNTGGVSLDDTLTKLTQYLLGHKNTAAVLAMGGMPMEMAPKAIADAGLKIPNAGFDITKTIIDNIKSGKSLATVDQQPYYQGLFTIVQLYFNKRFGLLPCDINTGGAIIDKTNADAVLKFADTVR